MSATTHGAINFSLSDQTGLFQESQSAELNIQAREIVSGGGEITAAAFYRHQGTFSIEGCLKTDESPTWDMATSLTLANNPTLESLATGTTSIKYIITSVSQPLGAEAEERRSISGNVYPFLPVAN